MENVTFFTRHNNSSAYGGSDSDSDSKSNVIDCDDIHILCLNL